MGKSLSWGYVLSKQLSYSILLSGYCISSCTLLMKSDCLALRADLYISVICLVSHPADLKNGEG